MLDESFPTYRVRPSSDSPLQTLVHFTHNGSDPSAEYLLKRPSPVESRNQYAVGLLDAHYASVVYAEVLIKPEWSQPTLSAAEVRANGTTSPVPLTPDSFTMSLYNPDQTIVIKHRQGSWGKSDVWEFEMPERSFKVPSASRIDQDGGESEAPDLTPKVVFRWKRDGRLSKDLTCFMSGRCVGGQKNKEPDITVAMFRIGRNESKVTIYEPNMPRVDVEDRKGLEVSFILGAEVIRDLYLVPRHNMFNTAAAASGPTHVSGPRKSSNPRPMPAGQMAFASGAMVDTSMSPAASSASRPPRVEATSAEENRKARERERRDEEEQKRIRKMLEKEEKERRRREAEVERETERLRREYGVPPPPPPPSGPSPALPPRAGGGGRHYSTNYTTNNGPWYGAQDRPPPVRPNSAGPPSAPGAGGRRKQSPPQGSHLASSQGGSSGTGVSSFFHRSEEDKRKRVQKRSVYF
ncbi:hypothetical protein DCS_03634 [Drechmeria coniospora]|uniref:Uncharacterized protein n=1 Tax=Drechmeria coniospora TaxID=98403 RepID=A0A151GHX2_DRECN|nr:hypothetical protein DCS_03634 [Drechmeria coniospora]KYK56632.1 hypothetical protein DCS_03634 [Drechmeria coniospora]ODA77070.1 hypothetical protein RJ55_07588 [Drechmeria coniospora]